MCIKVRQAKGGKDRYTLLSARLLETLCLYWRACRPRFWLFPDRTGDRSMRDQTAQRMYYAACDAAGIVDAADIASQLCNASARSRCRYPYDPASHGPRPCEHDNALFPFGAKSVDERNLALGFARTIAAVSQRQWPAVWAWPISCASLGRFIAPRIRCPPCKHALGALSLTVVP